VIEQQGQVVSVAANRVFVRLGGRSGCAACDAGHGCGAGIFGRLLRRRPVVLEFDNCLAAKPGQAVMVGLPESRLLALASRFYLYPLLAGLVGAVFGHYLSMVLETATGAADALTALAALGAGGLAAWRNRQWSVEFPDAGVVHLLRVVVNPELNFDKEVTS